MEVGGAERGRGALSSDRLAGLHEGSQAVRGLPAAAALSRGSRAQGAPTPEESPGEDRSNYCHLSMGRVAVFIQQTSFLVLCGRVFSSPCLGPARTLSDPGVWVKT